MQDALGVQRQWTPCSIDVYYDLSSGFRGGGGRGGCVSGSCDAHINIPFNIPNTLVKSYYYLGLMCSVLGRLLITLLCSVMCSVM